MDACQDMLFLSHLPLMEMEALLPNTLPSLYSHELYLEPQTGITQLVRMEYIYLTLEDKDRIGIALLASFTLDLEQSVTHCVSRCLTFSQQPPYPLDTGTLGRSLECCPSYSLVLLFMLGTLELIILLFMVVVLVLLLRLLVVMLLLEMMVMPLAIGTVH